MKIGNVDLGERPLLLAPMEDVTDIGFRRLCRQMGAAMAYSEFVASDALVRNVRRSLDKLAVSDAERSPYKYMDASPTQWRRRRR